VSTILSSNGRVQLLMSFTHKDNDSKIQHLQTNNLRPSRSHSLILLYPIGQRLSADRIKWRHICYARLCSSVILITTVAS